ncbi:hypothetical protein P389DRAFT_89255 [Cystobasidium minutum MCA 4210]|uniref:mitochondrial 54S ribosomal protein mL58 n=1 Tax=Cystobasidium minutum MCA 4210 TaxID=1397322 RepID=UPI0034CD4AE2|eukprot:jgi/Rhomi1/89255/CE89254_719
MQVARTTQRCLRSSTSSRLFSSCSSLCKQAAASTSKSSENSRGPEEPTFKTRPRFFDSLSKRESPKARHYDISDNPSIRLTVRPPSSPAPASLPSMPSTPKSQQLQSLPIEALPPRLHAEAPQYATLSEEQIAEMQALRLSDPVTWTRSKLAEKYNVSKFFVAMKSFGDSPEARLLAKKVREEHLEAEKRQRDSWGFKKRVDREVRRRRKEFW